MNRVRIYPYNMYSEGARALADALNVYLIKREGSKYVARAGDVVINWGNGSLPVSIQRATIINKPENVEIARNKLRFFRRARDADAGLNVPDFTNDSNEAAEWLREGETVLARSTLTGTGGEGITIVENLDQLNALNFRNIRLYVKYVPKVREYRVHVIDGHVVDIQRKVKRADLANDAVNWKIRNHENGFVFARGAVENVPERELIKVKAQAMQACIQCGLDFGGVDVIFNERRDAAYVIEVNTAPGIEGATVTSYANGLTALIRRGNRG